MFGYEPRVLERFASVRAGAVWVRCWRQSAGSGAGPDTSEALFVVEAQHDSAERDAVAAAGTIARLLRGFAPRAMTVMGSAGPDCPWFSVPPFTPQ